MVRVLGVDAAGKHWVAIASDLRAYAHPTLLGLLEAADADGTVEVHPEVSFCTLAGRHLPAPKSTWGGLEDRRALLAAAGFVLAAELGRPGLVAGPDDVLDAAVACWTARRVARGVAVQYPDPPERLDGIAASIQA